MYQKEIEITLEAVYQNMGFKEQTAVSPYLKNRVSHFIERGMSKFQPCIYYDTFKIRTDDEQGFLEFSNGLRFESQAIFNQVYGSNELVVGVATLGVEIKDLLDAVAHDLDFSIMEAVGSAAMESLTKAFWHDLVCSCKESGQGLTMRYSPGENGWLLREQRTVFELLSGQGMAVHLNEFEMMEPGMSLSFVYGITDDGVIEDEALAPLECSLYTRLLRKEPALYKLTLTSQKGTETLDVKEGDNLYDVIVKRGYPIDNACGGKKTCGQCQVGLEGGGASPLTPEEAALLQRKNAPDGNRLACFVKIRSDLAVTLPTPHASSQILLHGKSRQFKKGSIQRTVKHLIKLTPPSLTDQRDHLERIKAAVPDVKQVAHTALAQMGTVSKRPSQHLQVTVLDGQLVDIVASDGNSSRPPYGVAFDIGTTTIVAYLADLEDNRIIHTRAALNPQKTRGADVITRIHYTSTVKGGQEELQHSVVAELNRLILHLCTEAQIQTKDIFEAVAVGNTVMLHMLLGINAKDIAEAPFIPTFTETRNMQASAIGLLIHPEGILTTLPARSAYIGADTLAAVYASGMHKDDKISLLIDIGTNGEIVLGNQDSLISCSTAAGPAFEGGAISWGMGGVEGAIDHVNFDWPHRFTTIGGAQPKGICGSGLVDLVAELLRAKKVTAKGLLRDHDGNGNYVLDPETGISLSQADIRELQLAKGAVHAAVAQLMAQSHIKASKIERVYIAGGFGNYLDLNSAARIKLLPKGLMEKCQIIGNAAGSGAAAALCSLNVQKEIDDIKASMAYLELSGSLEFQERFVNSLNF